MRKRSVCILLNNNYTFVINIIYLYLFCTYFIHLRKIGTKHRQMKVTLRNKKLAKGKIRLYLDYYPAIINPHTGIETRREFLDFFLYEKPKTEAEREHNRQTKTQAETVKANRQIQTQQQNYDFLKNTTKTLFLDVFNEYLKTNKREKVGIIKHVEAFFKNHYIEEINKEDINAFLEYLRKTKARRKDECLSTNTQLAYYNFVCTVFNYAVKNGKIRTSPAKGIAAPEKQSTKREFLSLEEVIKLYNTPCKENNLKRMCLFSAMTGLRLSDLRQEKSNGKILSNGLKWSNIKHSEAHGYYIDFSITKTKEAQEMHYISKEAYELLGEKKDDNEFIFKTEYAISTKLRIWLLEAGINRKITFHCFRHTYATLLITQGIDIYTVSKMLGHKDIKTTQIYANIVDSKKKEAANSISLK